MLASNKPSAPILVCIVAALASAGPLAAQESRYGAWASDGDATRGLVGELRTLVDEAELARAADPRFLRDLRDLAGRYDIAARYDQPAQVELLRDTFADGEFLRSPAWSVTSGSFRVEPGWGLLSDVQATQAAPVNSGSKTDLAAALIAGLLSQQGQQGRRRPAPPSWRRASKHALASATPSRSRRR